MGRVEGKVVIVTGGANGMGRAACRRLAEEGATVVVADIDAGAGEASAEEAARAGGHAEFRLLDVTKEDDWQALVDDVVARHGRLDALVNAAAVAVIKPIDDMTLEEFHDVSMVNAYGSFVGARAAVLAMRRTAPEGAAAEGSIVNLSSTAGLTGMAGGAAFCATKGAVRNMCKTMGVECGDARDHIRINSIHPGVVRTETAERMLGSDWFDDAANFQSIPMKHYSRPEDVAEGIVFLVSDESRLVTGSELVIDGGATLTQAVL